MEGIEQNQKDNNIKSTIDAVAGLAKAIPVYQDAIQPAAKEVGKSLATVAKTINIALAPITALVWGYEKIKDFILTRVSEKLKDVPEENIVTPDPAVVGPSLEALRFSGNDINLRELFASLIATSMDSNRIQNAHPGFVEIIKNLSSDEAVILTHLNLTRVAALMDFKLIFKNQIGENDFIRNISTIHNKVKIKYPHLLTNYIDNLCRLGLTEIPVGRHLTDENKYYEIENSENIKVSLENLKNIDVQTISEKKYITMTGFGDQFCSACITRQNM